MAMNWVDMLRISRENNPKYKEQDDAHRAHAYAVVDEKLERGDITPEEAAERKADWDKRHGY
jgi:uncharacterized membrane protein